MILASILFDYLYRILKFLRNNTNAITAQAVGKEDSEGIFPAALCSGVIAIAIAYQAKTKILSPLLLPKLIIVSL